MSAGIYVPSYAAPAQAWQLVDWLDRSYTTPPAAGGTAQVALPPLDDVTRWLIGRAVVSSDSATPTVARLYNGQATLPALRSGTNTGNYDEADYARGLMIPPAGFLLVVWSGMSAGARGTVNVQAEVLRLAG